MNETLNVKNMPLPHENRFQYYSRIYREEIAERNERGHIEERLRYLVAANYAEGKGADL